MNTSIRTGFKPITHNIQFHDQKIKKGKDLSKKHIKRIEELHAIGTCKLIRCSCVRSYKVTKPPYKVQLDLNDSRHITRTSCSCASGRRGKCKHIYALIHSINTDRSESKTSQEQGWDKPSDAQMGKEIYAKPLVLADRYKSNDNFSNVEPYQLTLEDLKDINCPLRNILVVKAMQHEELVARAQAKVALAKSIEQQEKSDQRECVLQLIETSPRDEDLYSCDSVELEPTFKSFYEKNIKVNYHTVFETCINTITQSESDVWFNIRHNRISASSRAHKIKTRTRKSSDDLEDFTKREQNDKPCPAQEYGIQNEKKAVKEYVECCNAVVRHVGVFISSLQPWICGSPDGIVIEDGKVSKILEIKCPSSCRYKPVLDEKKR